MTEKIEKKTILNIPSLGEEIESDTLNLTDKEKEFLTSKYQEKFMTMFEVGSNKIKMYGLPTIMAQNSGIITSLLDLDPPYFLLSHIAISPKPLKIIWLYMNDYHTRPQLIEQLNLPEFFQLRRLIDYLDVDNNYTIGILSYWDEPLNNRLDEYRRMYLEKSVSNEDLKSYRDLILENKEFVAKSVNHYNVYARPNTRSIIYENFPEIMYLLNDVPVIDENGKIILWIKRELFNSPDVLNKISNILKLDKKEDNALRVITSAKSISGIVPEETYNILF